MVGDANNGLVATNLPPRARVQIRARRTCRGSNQSVRYVRIATRDRVPVIRGALVAANWLTVALG